MGSDHPRRLERSEVERVLFGKTSELVYQLTPKNKYARSHTRILSSLTGGNLEVVAGHQGTPWQIKTAGKILFLEEVNERGYRVDRKFQNFKQAGLLDDAEAIVFGDFIGGSEPDNGRKMWKDAIDDLAASVKLPVFVGLRSGHGHVQRPVPLNTEAVLEGKSLTVRTGARLQL